MALDQDLLAGKCVLQDQEHKLFTFADRKVGASMQMYSVWGWGGVGVGVGGGAVAEQT